MTTDVLQGHKTTIAATFSLLCGIAGLVFNFLDTGVALLLITSGLGFFGLGKKIERVS